MQVKLIHPFLVLQPLSQFRFVAWLFCHLDRQLEFHKEFVTLHHSTNVLLRHLQSRVYLIIFLVLDDSYHQMQFRKDFLQVQHQCHHKCHKRDCVVRKIYRRFHNSCLNTSSHLFRLKIYQNLLLPSGPLIPCLSTSLPYCSNRVLNY